MASVGELAERIRRMAAEQRRPNAIDAEWKERPAEGAFRGDVPPDQLANALVEVLPSADVALARYALWLALDGVPNAELPRLVAAAGRIADADARLLTLFLLLPRVGAATPAWVAATEAALRDVGPRASANLEATVDVLRKAVAEPARFSADAALAEGARRFDAGKYFEAHEAWEEWWRPMRGPERDLFRGLINLAVAMNKAREGNPAGVVRLLDRANGLLAPYPARVRGVDLAALRASIARLREQAEEWRAGRRAGLEPGDVPRLSGR